ncbi:MAG: AMP-binding protein [Planctomycetes bacterium]|nr:AMP-binding protein [Planctomycetota bacterium]
MQAQGNVVELVQQAEQRFGDAPFVQVGEELLTFAGYARRVWRAASRLRARGLQPGERVALLLPRSLEEAVLLTAVPAAGGVVVPVHQKLKDDQVRHVLEDAAPRLVVTDRLRTLALRDPERVLAGHDVQRDPMDSAGDPDARPEPGITGRQAAILLYTSGSTGRAKGIVQTHGNLALGAAIVARYLDLGPSDHVLALLPFSFDYGLNQLLSALHTGARLTAADHLGAGELAALLRRHRPTGLAGVPSLWHEVAAGLTSGTLSADDGRSLRYLTNSGGALRTADSAVLRREWPAAQVFAMYGLTEAFRSAFLPPDEFDAHPDSFGYAIDGVELLLVDDEGRVLEGPASGELVHCGALVADGYWQRPEETAGRFRPDPRGGAAAAVWSGDRVRRDDAGRHYFVARIDRLLKVHGHRISPDEVAQAVAGMPGVGEVFVFGVEGGADGHRIVLCVGGDPGDATLPAAIRRRCRSRLPSYMMPHAVHVLATLPHNQNGKVDEAALRLRLDVN